MRRRWLPLLMGFGVACSAAPTEPLTPAPQATGSAQPRTPEAKLAEAQAQRQKSEFVRAEAGFSALLKEACCSAAAHLGLSEVLLARGHYQEATATANAVSDVQLAERASYVAASALIARGELAAAEALLLERLGTAQQTPERTRSLRVLLGELLIEQGRRGEAEAPLMTLIEEYNSDVIKDDHGAALLWVARAATLLRSPEDANDAFNLAEKALGFDQELLLARAVLYLDNYDPAHAEEVLSEVLEAAPNQPLALALLAQVRLDQAMDFGEAKALAEKALAQNPHLGRAHFILAGLALRDMQIEAARAHVDRGLASNPRNLELLSMSAAAAFLADDHAAFDRLRAQTLGYNPQFSQFFQIIGEFADWEHRYREIVELMREAVLIDPDDAKAQAQLGLNWIRIGDDARGVSALQSAFAKDPFNARVINTLNLYEKVIPKEYVTESSGSFVFRYPREEQGVLTRYVPELMGNAFGTFRKSYDFTPTEPIGVELYYDREHFAVRTSGLPQIAIQGVCFGQTLAAMSPSVERFNLGMTLWHELAHVFHIQLSKSHVPRWFTEGLAEYETLVARAEWKRERDAELYLAWRERRLPKIAAMNEAFTHAESLLDVTVAYYASTQIVSMLAQQFGRPKLRQMLVLWGEGKSTETVFQVALGSSSEQLDARFDAFLAQRLSRFQGQFIPPDRVTNEAELRARAKRDPKDAATRARLALSALLRGKEKQALTLAREALKLDAHNAEALWVQANLALADSKPKDAEEWVVKLIASGNDGYEVQMLLARSLDPQKQADAYLATLENAHRFDPENEEPLHRLLQRAIERSDSAAQLRWLTALATLSEHDGGVYRRLTQLLLESGESQKAVESGTAALHADVESPDTHVLLAKAFEAMKNPKAATRAFETALACPAEADARAQVHLEFANYLERQGDLKGAQRQRDAAKQLDPNTAATPR